MWFVPLKIKLIHFNKFVHYLARLYTTQHNDIDYSNPHQCWCPRWSSPPRMGWERVDLHWKKYPISGEVPTFVREARSKTLAMPPECLAYIPSQKMSIMQQQYPHSARMAEHSPSMTHSSKSSTNCRENCKGIVAARKEGQGTGMAHNADEMDAEWFRLQFCTYSLPSVHHLSDLEAKLLILRLIWPKLEFLEAWLANPNKFGLFSGLIGQSKQIWLFLRPDELSEQKLTFQANACCSPNIWGEIFEFLSIHMGQIFRNFHLALSPIFGGPVLPSSSWYELLQHFPAAPGGSLILLWESSTW